MLDELRKLPRLQQVVVAVIAIWLAIFIGLKFPHVLSNDWIEWDARAMGLGAWRFHGSGLFPRDLGADLAGAMCPPGWKTVFWIGTLFTDPYQVSRLAPFLPLAFLIWQSFAFARRRGGIFVAALTIYFVIRCPFCWDRMVGANPRGFGIALVAGFLRYATEGRHRATALVLIAQAAFYPSVLLVCAPAWALLTLVEAIRTRKLQPLLWLAIAGVSCLVLVLPTLVHVDPRIGPPIKMEELAQLSQRGIWSLFPLPSHQWVLARGIHLPLKDTYSGGFVTEHAAEELNAIVVAIGALILVIASWRRRVPLAFVAVFIASLGAYALACAVAYRLYVPDRLIHYAWTPVILLLFMPLYIEAVALVEKKWSIPHATFAAAVGIIAVTTIANGTALERYSGLRDWHGHRTSAMEYLATLPTNVLVAAHPTVSSDVEVFAHRSVLFSGITNAPNFVGYGRLVEQRIGAFYDAYYASTLAEVHAFVTSQQIDYLIVDLRDFGRDAVTRASYVSPWTQRALGRLAKTPAAKMALAHPPSDAIVFRDGQVVVLDAHKL